MRIIRIAAFGLAALLSVALPAFAASPRPWVSGWLGGASYSMEDVNDLVSQVNQLIAGSGLTMEDVNHGWNYGGMFGLDVGNNFSVGVGYDRLEAMTDVGDATGKIELKVPGNLFRGFGRYTFPSASTAHGYLELSLGRVSSSGSLDLSAQGSPTETNKIEGSGFAFEGSGGVTFAMGKQVDLFGSLGYRAAKATDITVAGDQAYNSSGDNASVDWSGVVGRLGLTFAFSPRP